MARVLYDLVGKDGLRFSPYGWRARMALHHKGIEAEWEPVNFTDKEKIAFSGQTKVPILVDGDVTVSDSWAIACHLEETYPLAPTLFGSPEAMPAVRAFNHWVDAAVNPALAVVIVGDVFEKVDPVDQPYFRETREKVFGRTMEEMKATGDERLPGIAKALEPARRQLGEYAYFGGAEPSYLDYCLFGSLQWARCSSPRKLLADDDSVEQWRQRMLDLFDGAPRKAACCEAA